MYSFLICFAVVVVAIRRDVFGSMDEFCGLVLWLGVCFVCLWPTRNHGTTGLRTISSHKGFYTNPLAQVTLIMYVAGLRLGGGGWEEDRACFSRSLPLECESLLSLSQRVACHPGRQALSVLSGSSQGASGTKPGPFGWCG